MGRHDEFTVGTVVRWSTVDGWGVVESAELDGSTFVHFSVIRDQDGYRSLTPGQPVRFRWRHPGQDGCAYSATDVYVSSGAASRQPQPVDVGAFSSSLSIAFDDQASPRS